MTTTAADLHLLVVPAYQVSGIAVDANGRPAAGATVLLQPTPRSARRPPGSAVQSDGTFQIVNVPAGTYVILALMPVATTGVRTALPDPSEVVVKSDVSSLKVVAR